MTSKGYHKVSAREKQQKEELEYADDVDDGGEKTDDNSTGKQPKKFSRRYHILSGLLIVLMFGVGVTVGIVLRQKTGITPSSPASLPSYPLPSSPFSCNVINYGKIAQKTGRSVSLIIRENHNISLGL